MSNGGLDAALQFQVTQTFHFLHVHGVHGFFKYRRFLGQTVPPKPGQPIAVPTGLMLAALAAPVSWVPGCVSAPPGRMLPDAPAVAVVQLPCPLPLQLEQPHALWVTKARIAPGHFQHRIAPPCWRRIAEPPAPLW